MIDTGGKINPSRSKYNISWSLYFTAHIFVLIFLFLRLYRSVMSGNLEKKSNCVVRALYLPNQASVPNLYCIRKLKKFSLDHSTLFLKSTRISFMR